MKSIEDIYRAALEPEHYEMLLTEMFPVSDLSALGQPIELDPAIENHFRMALEILDKNDAAWQLQNDITAEQLSRSVNPAIRIASGGQIIDVNEAAHEVLEVQTGELVSSLPFDTDIEPIAASLHRLQVPTKIVPVRLRDDGRLTMVTLSLQSDDTVVLKTTDFHWPEGFSSVLSQTFSFTDAETQVVRSLIKGLNPADVAEIRDCKITTIRTQIRSIYNKTNVQSQTELASMVQNLANLTMAHSLKASDVVTEPTIIHPLDSQRHIIALPDGRKMEYADFGDPKGRPVLFMHDSFFGFFWPAEMVTMAERQGLRIIAPVRPAYGRSDGYEEGIGTVEGIVEDTIFLLDRLGIKNCVIGARTMGIIYALGVAHYHTQRVSSIVSFAPALPIQKISDLTNMPINHRFQATLSSMKPAMLEYFGRVGYSFYKRVGAEKLFRRSLKKSAPDLVLLDDPRIISLLEAGCVFSTSHKHLGWKMEMTRVPPKGAAPYIDCPVPLELYIGKQEANSRKDRAEALVAQGAPIKIHHIDDAGEVFFYSHAKLWINALDKASNNQ